MGGRVEEARGEYHLVSHDLNKFATHPHHSLAMHAALSGSNRLRDDERQAIAVGMMRIHSNLFDSKNIAAEDAGKELVRSHHLLAAVMMVALRLHAAAGGDNDDDDGNSGGGGGGTSTAAEAKDGGKGW